LTGCSFTGKRPWRGGTWVAAAQGARRRLCKSILKIRPFFPHAGINPAQATADARGQRVGRPPIYLRPTARVRTDGHEAPESPNGSARGQAEPSRTGPATSAHGWAACLPRGLRQPTRARAADHPVPNGNHGRRRCSRQQLRHGHHGGQAARRAGT
jgi:hypothetical protein